MTSSPSSFTRQFIASAWACSTNTNSVYIFLDHPVPARKHRRRQRCLALLSCRRRLHAHETFHRCVCAVNCTRHAVHLHNSRSKVASTQEEVAQQSSARPVQNATTLMRPILSSRHRPSGAVRSRKFPQAPLPTQGTATPFPAPASHDRPHSILHRRILGSRRTLPLTFTSSRVTFAMYLGIHPCLLRR
jgi:hypothetical protein